MPSKNLVDYAATLLLKDRADHAFSFIIFTLIVFVLSATLFISSSIQKDFHAASEFRPDIVVEALRAGKQDLMHDGYIYDISRIAGVAEVWGAVDGYYYFGQKRVWFHLIGDDSLKADEMIIGDGVKRAMGEFYYEDIFNFLTEEKLIAVKINKTAPSSTNIISNDVIYMNSHLLREILNLSEQDYTKIYVNVPNKNEVSQIALKIANLYPNVRAISTEDFVAETKNLYYYKGGIFMALYLSAMISFFILLKNQISLSYGEKRREIAILRSVGFCIKDIIALKLIQNLTVALSAYLIGCAFAYIYVFLGGAPLLRNIFLGGELENFVEFTPTINFFALFLLFIFSVIPFLAFVIIPSWKVAIGDISENVK